MKTRTDIKAGMGLGDCVAQITHTLKFDELAKLYEEASGKSCGCAKRREALNKLVPDILSTKI